MKINFIFFLMCVSILLAVAVFALLIHDMRKHKSQKAKIKKLSRKEFERRVTARQLIEMKDPETYEKFVKKVLSNLND